MANKGNEQAVKLYSGTYASKALIAEVTTLGLTINASQVDVTSKDSSKWMTMLAGGGLKSVEISVGGFVSDDTQFEALQTAALNRTNDVYVYEQPLLDSGNTTPGYYEGTFQLSAFAYEPAGTGDNAYAFTATLISSGAVTYTAEAA